MINPNDVAKALRLIADDIDSKGYDPVQSQSISHHIEGGVYLYVKIIELFSINTIDNNGEVGESLNPPSKKI